MLMWVAFAVLTALVIAVLTRPLMREGTHGLLADAADTEIYKDQLAEIDADQDRGLIAPAEADSARTELARRLLSRVPDDSSDNTTPPISPSGMKLSKRTAVAAALIAPFAAIGVYLSVGNPHLSDQPLAARLAQPSSQSSLDLLIAQVERRLRIHPDDAQGWEVIAPVYLRHRQFDKAATAYGRAIQLLGETPARVSGFVQATIMADNGTVGEAARKALKRLLELDPDHAIAKMWLAEARVQDGDRAGALAQFQELIKQATADDPWRAIVARRIEQLSAKTTKGSVGNQKSGPTQADLDAANQMSGEEQTAMVNRMVAGLAKRLETDTKDIDGWERLVHSYMVLGREKDARHALMTARKELVDDKGALARLDVLAERLGISS